MDKRLSPSQAIRAYCLWCRDEGCSFDFCPLHRSRFGKGASERQALDAIVDECYDCRTRVSWTERHDCPGDPPCPLYPFRLGTNPNRRRKKEAE